MNDTTPGARAATTDRTLSPEEPAHVQCRYDAYRAELLDALSQMQGGEHAKVKSLIVMDALDRLLIEEGLLPSDAPLYSTARRRQVDG